MVTLIDLLEIQRLKSGSEDLFDLLNGAELDERIDRAVLNNKILSDLGFCTPLYDTTQTFKVFFENFFYVRKKTISELLDSLEYVYNPIWNKDGVIVTEHDNNYTKDWEHQTDDSNENLVSAENVSDYQPNTKNVGHTTDKSIKDKANDKGKETRTEQGNIGLTSTQQLIKEQREVVDFNIYSWICNELKNDLFLLVY